MTAPATEACGRIRRDQFPALRDKVFLDAACASLAPRAAAEAIGLLVADIQACPARSATAFHIQLDQARDAARPEAARLIGCAPEDVALVENTSAALTIASRALPLGAGENILVPDLEYLQVPLAWRQVPPDRAPEIRMVRHVDGTLPVEAFAAAADARTRAVVLSSVQWSNGYRADLDAIATFCRTRRLWLVVDAIQQLGAFPVDVRRTPMDILVCGGHKWLNAPFGAGFMYLSPESRTRMREPRAGYLSVNPPDGGWGEYFRTPGITPLQPVTFTDEARRFETGGTGNYPGMVGLTASLRIINQLGPAVIEAHVRLLTELLIDGLDRLPVKVVTPRDPACRSGIVTFGLGNVGREAALIEHLLDRRIMVSHRYTSGVGGVRVSCHFFNTTNDVAQLLDETRAWLGAPGGATSGSPVP
jgi:cysteine desulfurase / selenocysteine lyase